jgi:hypothetical protein
MNMNMYIYKYTYLEIHIGLFIDTLRQTPASLVQLLMTDSLGANYTYDI